MIIVIISTLSILCYFCSLLHFIFNRWESTKCIDRAQKNTCDVFSKVIVQNSTAKYPGNNSSIHYINLMKRGERKNNIEK